MTNDICTNYEKFKNTQKKTRPCKKKIYKKDNLAIELKLCSLCFEHFLIQSALDNFTKLRKLVGKKKFKFLFKEKPKEKKEVVKRNKTYTTCLVANCKRKKYLTSELCIDHFFLKENNGAKKFNNERDTQLYSEIIKTDAWRYYRECYQRENIPEAYKKPKEIFIFQSIINKLFFDILPLSFEQKITLSISKIIKPHLNFEGKKLINLYAIQESGLIIPQKLMIYASKYSKTTRGVPIHNYQTLINILKNRYNYLNAPFEFKGMAENLDFWAFLCLASINTKSKHKLNCYKRLFKQDAISIKLCFISDLLISQLDLPIFAHHKENLSILIDILDKLEIKSILKELFACVILGLAEYSSILSIAILRLKHTITSSRGQLLTINDINKVYIEQELISLIDTFFDGQHDEYGRWEIYNALFHEKINLRQYESKVAKIQVLAFQENEQSSTFPISTKEQLKLKRKKTIHRLDKKLKLFESFFNGLGIIYKYGFAETLTITKSSVFERYINIGNKITWSPIKNSNMSIKKKYSGEGSRMYIYSISQITFFNSPIFNYQKRGKFKKPKEKHKSPLI